ncbi:MAG: hypothetical protein IKD69_12545, partial [Solobacterium sp.]|nr:hypothetical protein [Solobacterium sp.]
YYAGSNGEPDRGGRTWLFDDITENFRSAIIPFVEENYSVNKDAEGRALCGLSMGSLTTSTILQYSTDLFNYYGCFSGANVPDMEVKDLEELKTKHIYLTAGMIDMAYYSSASGVRTTAGLKDKLDTLGVAYDIDVLGGAHDWGVWRESVTNFAKDHTWGKGYTGFRNDEGSEISLRKIDEKLYWFENGVQQGVCGDPLNIWDTQFDKLERGREIYDENSDAWYWLDANDNGAVACNKEVWMPYVIQGDGDPDGKWVRYDRYGQMIKGWYADDNGVYYYDLVTGAMAKGEKTINEKTYVFDENHRHPEIIPV